ncbi:MAG TPA: 4Fe-4S binding protein [bacterium]|nr:4Fe-4S binding protein [bacterium]HNT65383.1 4Fe-4S binding protein [bacterium]HOX86551.1 4Fe-4S binding protein [bacterium]HPG46577.1 4Fe-4S binding protein [bacterium]HPM98367.1 4Fe-4S binding protein [bacterium]
MDLEKGLESARVVIREDECKGCGLCINICPEKVLFEQKHLNRMGYHPAGYLGTGCIGCGFCFYQCPEPGAITVYKKGYVGEEVER